MGQEEINGKAPKMAVGAPLSFSNGFLQLELGSSFPYSLSGTWASLKGSDPFELTPRRSKKTRLREVVRNPERGLAAMDLVTMAKLTT